MKNLLFLFIFSLATAAASGQKMALEKSHVSFFSHATVEDITAANEKTVSIFNSSTGDIAFSVPIKEFQFAKSLMQEHFNEKYMESEKYPKATFQGKIKDFNMTASGEQQAKAEGKLSIHGVTKDIAVTGTFEKQGEKVLMKSKFIVKLEDYKIKIPQLLWQNIAEQVEVTLDFTFKPQ